MAAAAVARIDQYDEAEPAEAFSHESESKAYYLDDEEPLSPIRHEDKRSERSASLESVEKKAMAQQNVEEPGALPSTEVRDAAPANEADLVLPGRAKELPPGALGQELLSPPGGPVEDVTPPSPSPGVSPQDHLSAALRQASPSLVAGFHQWPEAEMSPIKGEQDEVLRVYCGIWNLHGKRAPSDLHDWIPLAMRHHIYAIGTCECERSLEKSLIWASKARWERQMQDYFGEEYRMIGSNTMSAVHLMLFLHRSLWKYCAEVETCHVATGFANVIGNKGSTQAAEFFCNLTWPFAHGSYCLFVMRGDYLRSASGRHFVCAQRSFEEALQELDVEKELTSLIAKVQKGHLIELQEICGDWGYGVPLVYGNGKLPMPGSRGNPGAFRLDWVKAVCLKQGLRREDVDISMVLSDWKIEPKTFHDRFEAIRCRKALDRVAALWDRNKGVEVKMGSETDVAEKVAEILKTLDLDEEVVLLPSEGVASRPLAEVILEDIIKADCKEPAPPPGLGPLLGGAMFSPSPSTSSGEAHDADDDEGLTIFHRSSPRRRGALGRRSRKREGRLSPEAFSSTQSPNMHVGDDNPDTNLKARRQRHSTLSSLLQANRTGKLQRLLENLRQEQQDMVRSAVDLQDLKERFKVAMLSAHRTGELHKVAEKLATEVERRADDFQRLKERALESLLRMKRAGELDRMAQEMRTAASEAQTVEDASSGTTKVPAKQRALQSLLDMKKSGELQLLAEEMDSAQKKFEAKAAQFREISTKMRRGMVNAMRNGELERLVGEMTEVLETQAESIRSRVRKGLLRAHRRGELQDLRQELRERGWRELDELADEVPSMPLRQRGKRWPETISSDSDPEAKNELSSNEGSDVDTKLKEAAAVSSWQAQATKPRKRWADMNLSSDSDLDPVQVGRVSMATKHLGVSSKPSLAETEPPEVAFRLGNTKLLFMNNHLAAHAEKMKERTESMHRILESSPLRKRKKDMSGVHREYDRVFFMGDLNTRVDAAREQVDAWLAAKQFDHCMAADQLLPLLKGDSGHAGLWPDFQEAQINFPPTYKFDKYSEVYDSSKKQRVPSWTDRILWKKDPFIKSMSYNSVSSLQCSDHRPVFSQFEVKVDLNWSGPASSVRKSSICTVQ
eukprot:symbB.v1.2.013097.t1/scaffold919.1/size152209/9